MAAADAKRRKFKPWTEEKCLLKHFQPKHKENTVSSIAEIERIRAHEVAGYGALLS